MRTLPLVVLSTLVLATGCSADGAKPTTSSPTAGQSSTSQASVLRATFKGVGSHPTVSVRVPSAEWSLHDGFAVVTEAGDAPRGVSFWDVGKVARDPCHSVGKLYDPGPSVDDLVRALQAQTMRNATPPRSTTLAGHPATYVEWSVPADLVVTGDSDFVDCDVQGNGHRDFVSWEGRGGEGERFQQMAGQVDRLWILDVDGQRLVVDASHAPNATPAQLAELDEIVASVQLLATKPG